MNVFLVAAQTAGQPRLQHACDITERMLPRLGCPVERFMRELPEIHGGWFYFLPHPPPRLPRITEYCNDRVAVLAFGEVFENERRVGAAGRVLEAWQTGGLPAARALDGSFSAVIVDRTERSVVVVSDLLGRRTCRYFSDGESLLVSNNDLPIVATGRCPVELDLDSACSVLALDWSLGGKGLVRRIEVCHACASLCWRGGTVEVRDDASLIGRDRIDPNDHQARRRHLQRMVERMRERARGLAGEETVVRADLTAGLDSRAAFAALVSSIGPTRIVAWTSGERNSTEIRTARRIARAGGVPHEAVAPTAPTPEGFWENCRAYAFFFNGDTNGKRALGPPLRYDPEAPITLGGCFGEVFRGYYYPWDAASVSLDDAIGSIKKKHRRHAFLPWKDRAMLPRVLARLEASVGRLAGLSPDGFDVLDLFYILERYGRWAIPGRMPTNECVYSLFESVPLTRLAFQLPAPIGSDAALHRTLIKTLLPGAYWLPVNGDRILALDDIPGGWRIAAARDSVRRWARRGLAMIGAGAAANNSRTIDQLRADWFAGPLAPLLREVLTARNALAAQIFGTENTERMIDRHAAGVEDSTQALGILTVLEHWKEQLAEAERSAAQGTQDLGAACPDR